ncbi:hypothetical protein GLOIN_2v1495169, partial [Rhizophagus irregularis DAOM 181602=DAOM 197198]
DNFINLSIKLKNQCNNSREKAYHCLMREVFNTKVFHEASIQAGHISKAEYLRNKIDDRIVDFIIQIGKGKKKWLSRGSVATLHKATSTERVVDLLNDAENEGPRSYEDILQIFGTDRRSDHGVKSIIILVVIFPFSEKFWHNFLFFCSRVLELFLFVD